MSLLQEKYFIHSLTYQKKDMAATTLMDLRRSPIRLLKELESVPKL